MFVRAFLSSPLVGEDACSEETVHTDHPAGPKGEGELSEGEEQPSDDATAGERCRNTRKKVELGVSRSLTEVSPSFLGGFFLQEKENLNNLEKKYGELTGGRSFPVNPLSMKEVRCENLICQSKLPGSK